MKKVIAFFLLLALLLTGCGGATVADNPGSGDASASDKAASKVELSIVPATDKLTNDADLSTYTADTLIIGAARGETEPGQFLLTPNGKVQAYTVQVSDLINANGTISAENVNVQVELYGQALVTTYNNSRPDGYYPDALIPVQYIVNAGENTMSGGHNQGFYVDIKVPEDAQAGVYTGEIVVDCDGIKTTVPVELEVFDFAIRQVPYTKTCYLIWQNWLNYGELDGSDETYMRYYDVLNEYNVCAYSFPHTTAAEFVDYVRQYYSKVAAFGIPYDAINNTTNDWEKCEQYLYAIMEASIADGVNYVDKAYYYMDQFYDEYNFIQWRKDLVKSILQTCNDLEEKVIDRLVAEGKLQDKNGELANTLRDLIHVIPITAMDDSLNEFDVSYCLEQNNLQGDGNYVEFKKTVNPGIEYWTYNCLSGIDYPNQDKAVNGFLQASRDHYWRNYELDIIGDLYWCVNGYCTWASQDMVGGYNTIADLYTTYKRDWSTNGDGFLMYPGLPYGSEKPFGSLRLAALRDGIDENTYMGMLGEMYVELAGAYGVTVTDAKGYVSYLNDQISGRLASKLNSEEFYITRRALAKAVELATNQDVIIRAMSAEENTFSFEIYTQSDCKLLANDQPVESKAAGQGLCYSATVALPADGRMVLEFESGGDVQELVLVCPENGTEFKAFEEASELSDCKIYEQFGSKLTINTNERYSVSGNSAKLVLEGHDFADANHNQQFLPSVTFDLSTTDKKLTQINAIEMWVYNDSDKDLRTELFLHGEDAKGNTSTVVYNNVYLKANSWNKIVLDNFQVVSFNASKLDVYTEFGLRIKNSITGSNVLYLDSVFIR